jgi:hypothetical protein
MDSAYQLLTINQDKKPPSRQGPAKGTESCGCEKAGKGKTCKCGAKPPMRLKGISK